MNIRPLYLYSSFLFCFMSCQDDTPILTDLNDREQQIDRLVRTWIADQVTYEGYDVTRQDFSDFSITFNRDNTWTASDGGDTFGSRGSWVLEENLSQLSLNGVPVEITFSPDNSMMRMEFVLIQGSIGARRHGIGGEYVIELSSSEQLD